MTFDTINGLMGMERRDIVFIAPEDASNNLAAGANITMRLEERKIVGRLQELFLRSCYNGSLMSENLPRKNITSRIIRPGDRMPQDDYWDKFTPEERMNAVWELTLLCLAWQPNQADEPRLQRSISRIQRPAS
jgi:hypothetical protein